MPVMDSSHSKALLDILSSEYKKAMTTIADDRQAGRQTVTDDIPMKDADEDEPVPPLPSMHLGITISKSRTHYTNMTQEEQEAKL
ncbi:U-box domain-containing protein 9 [Hordeum vulgare]|nr:U-box domain-containing protein 9 [Hordeum vulgare]